MGNAQNHDYSNCVYFGSAVVFYFVLSFDNGWPFQGHSSFTLGVGAVELEHNLYTCINL